VSARPDRIRLKGPRHRKRGGASLQRGLADKVGKTDLGREQRRRHDLGEGGVEGRRVRRPEGAREEGVAFLVVLPQPESPQQVEQGRRTHRRGIGAQDCGGQVLARPSGGGLQALAPWGSWCLPP
jgi:hypothetical protein